MKTPTIPTLLGPDGMTSLREYAGYHGGGSGFGGQLRAWNPPGESVDAALLPNFTRGNARADDLVRNNGYPSWRLADRPTHWQNTTKANW